MPFDLEFNKNEDQFRQMLEQLHHKSKKVKLGGGQKKIDEQHQKGKLTARERYLTGQTNNISRRLTAYSNAKIGAVRDD